LNGHSLPGRNMDGTHPRRPPVRSHPDFNSYLKFHW
jgi:hypothetical protein